MKFVHFKNSSSDNKICLQNNFNFIKLSTYAI